MKTFKDFLNEDRWYDEPEYLNFGNADLRRLYGAIQSAEHRGTTPSSITGTYGYSPELYIRTRSPVKYNAETGKDDISTAYGPVQITRKTASDFIDAKPELFKNLGNYATQFLSQGKKMLANKGYGASKQYGGGGAGDLSGEQYHSRYQQLAAGIMRGKMQELGIDITKDITPEDRERFIKSWRGKSRKSDPKYYEAVDKFLSGQ